MGKSASDHCSAANWKFSLISRPVKGVTTKTPGSGAPLVVSVMEVWPLSHARLNCSLERCGSALDANMKLNTCSAWPLPPNGTMYLLVGVSVFLFGFVIFAFGWLGGGDAKLMAATAFWWQWTDLLMYVTYTTLAGGVIALFILWGRKYVPVKVLTADWLHRLVKDEKRMPYGLALAFGALVTLPQSEILRAAVGLG